jgi:hypothetical protein
VLALLQQYHCQLLTCLQWLDASGFGMLQHFFEQLCKRAVFV